MAIGDPDPVTAFGALHRELSVLYGKVARSYGLTPQQLELLCLVHKSRPTFGELAAALGCDKTNVTGMVDRLERRELLAREQDPADRRITRAVLTGPGLALRDDIRATLERQLAARLPGTQRDRMIDAVATAAAALAQSRPDPETH
ncbi:MarR family winged helix-turn-helix transcriptional regulator [Nocardia cerradoensis]|uniref:HTH-type transcriptional regulator MhqR n=1 Tax=Nocardia cerradoensis TaxID=85688 RepID=A0A231GWB6_9NOCA|nr:MarR family transcriptional regulator [Nocardia cerradoensis]NKY43775.1 MarR family transcriptional regulator [Nocardia cerradoensis]OXR40896.1 HTH-type transcriptional regulator MhqR [Nocardia cerradoensis]